MKKIVFIGGGSSKFVRELTVDLLRYPELSELDITLMDIDGSRAERSRRLVERIISERKLPARVSATTDRRRALDGANYVIVTIMVGGFDAYRSDVAIPERYGVLQAVSDTIGPGAVMRLVRTAPVLAGIASEVRELAPRAWVLNYANPMAMNVWALHALGLTRSVGLCHSIQWLRQEIGRWLDIPPDEIDYTAGGLNHVDFYLSVTRRGRDLYPDLLAAKDRILEHSPSDRSRFELLEHLGYFPAEGGRHQTEYYPWFRKNDEKVRRYAAPTYWGYEVDHANFEERAREVEEQIAGKKPISYERSLEYGATIVHALETGEPTVFYANVPNHGLIENLPPQATVEVPCVADRNGIVPCRVGRIPPQLAAVMTPHIAVHEMAVLGVMSKNRTLLRQAIAADPLAGAILTLGEIHRMVDEMLEANRAYLDGYA